MIRHRQFEDHFILADLVNYMVTLNNFCFKIDEFYHHYLVTESREVVMRLIHLAIIGEPVNKYQFRLIY